MNYQQMQGPTPNAQYPLMGNQYGNPANASLQSQQMPSSIVLNQQEPSVFIPPNMFKLQPVSLNCNFCNKPITTTVTQEFNCCACLLCWCTGLLCYVCIQCIRGKDLCCYDATHRCPYCNNTIAIYQAC